MESREMKKKRIWKKIVSYVLATIMLVSIFSTVDMGWNVIEVMAKDYVWKGSVDLPENTILNAGDTIKPSKSKSFTVYLDNKKVHDSMGGSAYTVPSVPTGKCYIKRDTPYSASSSYLTIYLVSVDHNYSSATCQKKQTCSKCGATTGSLASHNYNKSDATSTYFKSAATCTSPAEYYKHCQWCTATGTETFTSGDALGHDWSNNDGVCTRASSHICGHGGKTTGDCEICGKTLHSHGSFEYKATGNQLTATCKADGCTDPAESKTITINQASGAYTGSAFEATLDGTADFNSLTGKSVSTSDIKYYKDDEELTEAPKTAGTYKAKITVEGATATKEFSITKINPVVGDFTYTAPSSLAYDGNGKTATVVANEGKTNGTITVKYYAGDSEVTSPRDAGTYTVKIDVTEGDNYNAVTDLQIDTFAIGKGGYAGDKTASGNLVARTDKTVDITLPELPDGASYGTVTNSNTGYFTVGTVSDGKVTVTSAKDWNKDSEAESKTFTIRVTGATNYSDYDVTVTINPVFHTHAWNYEASGATITAKCEGAEECYVENGKTDGVSLTLKANSATYSDGDEYTGATLEGLEAFKDAIGLTSDPAITYYKVTSEGATTGGTEKTAEEVINSAGNYYASITVNGKTAVKAFVVNKLEGPEAPTGLNPIPPKHIDGEDGKIEGVDDTMEYSTDGGETWKPVTGNEITGLKAGDVKVRVKGTETTEPGASTTVTIEDGTEKNPAPDAPSGLNPIAPQTEGGSDGKITGVDDTMEYSPDDGETWIPVEEGKTEITGLKAGKIKVRKKGTDTTHAGNSVSITVPEGTPEKGSIKDIIEYVDLTGTPEVGETLTVTVVFKDGKSETLKYQWYRDSQEIADAVENKYVLTEEDRDKIVKVRVTCDGYNDFIDKATGDSVHGKFIPHIENPAVPTEVAREELKAAISKEALSEDAKQKLESGKDIIVELVVKDNDHIEEASKVAITSALEEAKSDKEDVKVEKYLDISLFWYFEDETEDKNKIETAEKEITISLKVPDADPDKEYAVVRNHKGDVSILGDYDSETETITIKSHLFSDYAICSWKADGKKAKVEKKSDKKKEKKEPDIDYDTFKSELPSRSVLAINPDDTSKIIDMKVHALDKKIASNQELLANSFASQLGKKAKIVLSYGVYARSYVPMNEDGAKKTLVWNNLSLKTPGEIYAICYNQKDGAYYLAGTVDAKGTAVFNNFLYRDATNITLFTLE